MPASCASAKLAVSIVAAAWVGCGQPTELPPPPPPDRVVLVSFDTTRADRIGAYGASGAHTPTLDELARRGVRFEHAIAPTPMTQPSHATLFTALDPPLHGLRTNGSLAFREDIPTLAEKMREAGYATAAFLGALVLEAQFGLNRGFDHYDDVVESRQRHSALGLSERRAEAVVDAALRWIESAPDRFFLFVHFFDPHDPYDAPSLLARLWTGSPYQAEIAYADHQLGRLLERIRARWPDRRTLVAVTSDHGESLGEHGEPTHSYSIYDATQHVPLILAGPGVPMGVEVSGVVRLADVAPTLLGLAEAGALPEARGQDLSPLWMDPETPSARVAYVETMATWRDFGWSPLFGVRTPTYKYIRAPRPELYDLRSDPEELENVASGHPDAIRDLDEEVSRLLHGARAPREHGEVDERTRRRLQSLGYLMSSPAPRKTGATPGLEDGLGAVGGPDPKDHIHTVAALRQSEGLVQEGKPMAALAVLQDLEPSPLVSSRRSHLALLAGREKLAERHAREAIESGEPSFHAYARLGSALVAQGRLKHSEDAYRKAQALTPGAPEPLVGLGVVEEQRGRRREAEKLYLRALQTKLFSADAHWRLAALYIEAGRHPEAQGLLRRVDERLLDDPRAASRLARAELRAGLRDAARRRVERALDRYPEANRLRRLEQRLEAR